MNVRFKNSAAWKINPRRIRQKPAGIAAMKELLEDSEKPQASDGDQDAKPGSANRNPTPYAAD